MNTLTLRLGTRGSLLARAQSEAVGLDLLRLHPHLQIDTIIFKTTGDQVTDRPLHEIGGKGLFTKELEHALLAGQIDFAVHSLKDVPVTMPLVPQEELIIAAVPARADPRDALVSSNVKRLSDLPVGARVGTGSLRRQCQILARRPDLIIEPVRGNLDTRLRKVREGQFDAIILAMAGLNRSRLYREEEMTPIEPNEMLPAAGQGALALQCRGDAECTRSVLAAFDDAQSHRCVQAERAIVAGLRGDCHSPIAALATIDAGDRLTLRAAVGASRGRPPVVTASGSGPSTQLESIVDAVLSDLAHQGAMELLSRRPPA